VVRDQLNNTRKWMTVTVKAELDKPGGGVYGTTKPVTAQGLSPDHIDRMVRRMGHVAGSDEREKLPKSQEDKVAAVRRAYQEVLDSNEDNSGFKDVSLIATLNRAARIAAIHSIYGDIEPGWAKEGEKAKSEEVKKSGIAELNDFLSRDTEDRTMRKADQDQTQGMPEGDQKDFPQMDAAGGSLEDGEKPTTVKKGEKSAPIDFQDTVGAAPKAKQDALSDDEEEDEDQMEPHKKPIEESLKSLTPARQRDLTAKDRAAKIAQLRKSRDITLHPYSDARIHAGVEDVIERRLNKSETYVEDPSLVPGLPLIAQGVLCKSCGHKHTAAVTACPHCGSGVTISQVVPGVAASGPVGVLQKSAAHVLRPAKRESDLRFDGGNVPLKE
jgi:rubrerythrin